MVKRPQKPPAQEQLQPESRDQTDKLEALRAEIDIGIRQLDAGLGQPLDVEEFLRRANAEHTGR
jgi:hypothetical protein